MDHKTLNQHLFSEGPKRILALDGGGVRGILTLGYLARIEKILRERHGDDREFRLSDYFDLIGGTSTGSIIAAALALGFSVSDLLSLYLNLAHEIFKKPIWRFGLYVSKFPDGPLRETLSRHFGTDTTIGSEKITTGLMVISKRLDTGSPWVIHNNPRGRYYNKREGRKGVANKDFLLSQVVRASTAAPHYFEPERIQVGTGEDQMALDGAFVDGGVSPWNNPALQMLMLANLRGFGLQWPLGADNLLLVSVGTGYSELRLSCDDVCAMPASVLAMRALLSLMDDCDWLGQTVLQWLSRTKTGWAIDREIGDLSDDLLGQIELLTYLRYNVNLDSPWLWKTLQITKSELEVEKLRAMDDPTSVNQLEELGREAAEKQIEESHFPAQFDLRSI